MRGFAGNAKRPKSDVADQSSTVVLSERMITHPKGRAEYLRSLQISAVPAAVNPLRINATVSFDVLQRSHISRRTIRICPETRHSLPVFRLAVNGHWPALIRQGGPTLLLVNDWPLQPLSCINPRQTFEPGFAWVGQHLRPRTFEACCS